MEKTASPEYIDVHAHVNFPDYDADRDEVISRSLDAGTWLINVGTSLATSQKIVEIAERYEQGVYAIVGLHPTHVEEERFDIVAFEKLVAHPKTVGVGECGIDLFRLPEELNNEIDRARVYKNQEEDFLKQIDLAVKYDKPVMIHARESYQDILKVLDAAFITHGAKLRGNAHFFAGSIEEAKAFLDRGFTVSFTGVITFAAQYRELVKWVPLDRMLSETDCPFVTPVPFRGKRNEPLYVQEVVKKIAEIKELPIEEVKKALLDNARRQFGI
ncbi:MAG TPA: TatD family hydrolase [Candidatus Paceibacterota bacterium]